MKAGYLLFIPEDQGAFAASPAEATAIAASPIDQAIAHAVTAVQLSEAAGVERISADAQAYLERVEQAVPGALDIAPAIGNAQASAGDRDDVQTFATVGAIAVDHLTAEESAKLREAGFDIVPNNIIYGIPTTETNGSTQGWHLAHCGADQMHAEGVTGKGQRIGILDTGIDASHPEFAGKSIEFAEFDHLGKLISSIARDSGDHGTHVAAIAAGRTIGLAKDADVAMAAVLTRVTSRGNSGYLAQIIGGLEWLIGMGSDTIASSSPVTVVNASLGASGYNGYLRQTIGRARALGIPFVASIGNAGRKGVDYHGSPGNYDWSIGVGACDSQDAIAAFSDWGTVPEHGGMTKPDLSAPGVDIYSAVPSGAYAPKSGTSMAAPCVAGAIALLVEELPSLDGDVQAIEAELYRRLKPLAGEHALRTGRGRLALR